MIDVGFFTDTDAEWDAIKTVVQKALNHDADEVVLEITRVDGTKDDVTLRIEIEGTARVHLARDKVLRSLPTQMDFREWLTDLSEDAKRLRDGIVGSRAFRATHNDYSPDKDMLVATDAYFEKLLRNLDGIIEALGPPRRKSGGAAAKNLGRDLFWLDLLAIWCQVGGKATGKGTLKAAAFLRAVSVPVFNAMPEDGRDGVPDDPRSIAQWLRRQSPTPW